MEATLTGHVEELGRDRWRLVVNLRPEQGEQGRRYPRTTKTVSATGKKRALKALGAWIAELEQHNCTDPSRITVGEVLRRWLEQDAQYTTRPKTYERYEQLVTQHLTPRLGALVAAEFKPADWSQYHSLCRRSGRLKSSGGLSEQTCAHLFHVLHRAFSWAVEEQLLTNNPLSRVRKRARPSPPAPRRATWNDEQTLSAIELAYANGRPTMLYIPLVLAAWAGLRRSEICGLGWDNVYWDDAALRVRRTVEQTAAGLHDLDPKSETSNRIVLVPQDVIDVLREHKTHQDEMRLVAGSRWNAAGRVVCRTDGSPMPPDAISNRWSEWVKRRRLEPYVSFHGLRHSYATGLYDAGARTKTVQERLGHSTPAITAEIYIHGTKAADQALVQIQEQRIAAARTARNSHSVSTDVVSITEARARKCRT